MGGGDFLNYRGRKRENGEGIYPLLLYKKKEFDFHSFFVTFEI